MRVGLDRALYWTDGEIGPRSRPEAGGSRPSDFDGMGSARSGPRSDGPGRGRADRGGTVRGRGRGDRGGLERVGIGPTGIGLGRWELDSTEHCIGPAERLTERRRPEVGGVDGRAKRGRAQPREPRPRDPFGTRMGASRPNPGERRKGSPSGALCRGVKPVPPAPDGKDDPGESGSGEPQDGR
ncbi:hypothetical protein TNIN_291581 [Trichonephila inaurata madagascariensis]|uniref:Uncharacterized protein n=1 Tax=Trichonephila inaurata madagascariensis TaxID=2747483 RepID=A0A8X6WY49_9ARAC|nr:hypothetical protein TNIN_291581 [Trichonephila inaurata madagascariensis]